MNTIITCVMQNRLGAFDRVLAIMTHRGILPNSMVMTTDAETGRMKATFNISLSDQTALTQLARALQKQVYVMSVAVTSEEEPLDKTDRAEKQELADKIAELPAARHLKNKYASAGNPASYDPFQTQAFQMRS